MGQWCFGLAVPLNFVHGANMIFQSYLKHQKLCSVCTHQIYFAIKLNPEVEFDLVTFIQLLSLVLVGNHLGVLWRVITGCPKVTIFVTFPFILIETKT